MDGMEEKLREYIKKTINDKKYGKQIRRNWAFGAVDFAFSIGLIEQSTHTALMDEYFGLRRNHGKE